MRCGTYRCVIFIGNCAIKLPRLSQLTRGLRCNKWENEIWNTWRPTYDWDHLCPVIAAAPFGLCVVMRKANQPVPPTELDDAIDTYDYYPDVLMEYKPENWGQLDGKVVCLDYGIDNANLINKQRAYYESKKAIRTPKNS